PSSDCSSPAVSCAAWRKGTPRQRGPAKGCSRGVRPPLRAAHGLARRATPPRARRYVRRGARHIWRGAGAGARPSQVSQVTPVGGLPGAAGGRVESRVAPPPQPRGLQVCGQALVVLAALLDRPPDGHEDGTAPPLAVVRPLPRAAAEPRVPSPLLGQGPPLR